MTTYTQVMGENGEIRYVPTTPPPPEKESTRGSRNNELNGYAEELYDDFCKIDIKNEELTKVMENLITNNKKLRFNKRLENGKLDGNRLASYKTSKKLFKKKKISEKNYQFTFLIDTSGSMQGEALDMAVEAVISTVNSLEELKIRTSIFSMNMAFRQAKAIDEELNVDKVYKNIAINFDSIFRQQIDGTLYEYNNAGGTSEWVAYEETVNYLAKNTPPKVTNVVIILSDGAPGGEGYSEVIIDNERRLVKIESKKNRTEELAKFWDKNRHILAYGLGIYRKATQVPTNKKIDDIKALPDVMGKLLTDLMM